MARSVADMAALLTVMAGTDPEDPATKEADTHKTDYLKGLDANALKGARLGVVRGTSNDNETTAPVFEKALKVLEDQGAVLVDVPATFFEDLFPEQHTLIHWEFGEDLEAYLKNTPPQVKVRTLAALVEFNKTDPREKLHAQELLEADLANKGRAEPEYAKMLEYAQRRAGPEGLGAALTKYNVNAFVMINSGPARQRGAGARGTGASSIYLNLPPKGKSKLSPSGISALAGFPDVSVPIGLIDELPIGMSLIGPKWSEQHLLSLAYAYEQVAKARVPPTAYLNATDSAQASAQQGKTPAQK
jgi:amidase